jgi:hypothetical protein
VRKILFLFLLPLLLYAEETLSGFWTTFNPQKEKAGAIVAVYLYEDQYYGRIIGTYNENGVLDDTIYAPKEKAPGVIGNPYYSGLDIVWTTKALSNGKYKGYVIDPKKGKTYSAKVWRQGEDFILRGELFIFGKNVSWYPFEESLFTTTFPKPNVSTFVPKIPKTTH